MSPVLSDEQKMLEDSVRGLLQGADATLWQGFAEMGLLAMPFCESDGGLGSSADDLMVVTRQLGKHMSSLPFTASAIVGGYLLSALATAQQKGELLPPMMDGTAIMAFAHSEPNARYRRAQVAVRAEAAAEGYRLHGLKSLVSDGAAATHFIVSARTSGAEDDGDGISLFLVPASAEGLRLQHYVTPDEGGAVDVVLDDVLVPDAALLGRFGEALPAIEAALDHGVVAAIGAAVGGMEELLDQTVDYLKLRKQFRVAIGSFQSLQHKAVDMFIEVEQARSMAIYAASVLSAGPGERQLGVAAAKAQVNAAARFVGETAVQLHGAIGMTMESGAGRLFRQLTLFQLSQGDRDYCLRLLGGADTSILEA